MGLVLENVERRARDAAFAQRLDQGFGVDECAARDVDEHPLRTERIEHFGVDEVMRFGTPRDHDNEEVRPLGERLHVGKALVGDGFFVAGRVAHFHFKGGGALREDAADAAEPGDADALAKDAAPEAEVFVGPAARTHEGVGFGRAAREGKQQREAEVGDVAAQYVGGV